jgi:hypothetical protein
MLEHWAMSRNLSLDPSEPNEVKRHEGNPDDSVGRSSE